MTHPPASTGRVLNPRGIRRLTVQELEPGQSQTVVLDLDKDQRENLDMGARRPDIARVEFTVFSHAETQEPQEISTQVLMGRATAGGKMTAVDAAGRQLAAYQATWTWDYVERQRSTIVGKDQSWWGPSWTFNRDIIVNEIYNAATWEYHVERRGVFKDGWFRERWVTIAGVLRSNGRSAFWGWIS